MLKILIVIKGSKIFEFTSSDEVGSKLDIIEKVSVLKKFNWVY